MRTALYDIHLSLDAKMVDFHGWEMPLQYSGIIDEHITTRSGVGVFDVSHMGRFEIEGDNSANCLQSLLTNDLSRLPDRRALYSPICNENGGIIDDLIVYRKSNDSYILIVNASNRKTDFEWISSHLTGNIQMRDVTLSTSLVAVQGPNAKDVLQAVVVNSDLFTMRSFDFIETQISGIECLVSRTGYTGEDGFEIMFDASDTQLWQLIFDSGRKYQIKPCGLGSRDTLRLEAGLLLHGNDMDQDTTPLEVPLKWTVKFEKGDFIGKKALISKKRQRKLAGFEILESKRIARHGNRVLSQRGVDQGEIGVVTSGGYSPSLNKSIGFCFVPLNLSPGTEIETDIGGKLYRTKTRDSIRFIKRPA